MALRSSCSNIAVLVVVHVILLTASIVDGANCPGNLVYPFNSECDNPARYYGEDGYEFGIYSVEGSLAPEWDEANSTYYMRLAESGALYKFTHDSPGIRLAVGLSDDVKIVNVETGRTLAWRQDAEDEYFLVEAEVGATLQFATYDEVTIPCVAIYTPIACGVYNILNFGTSGFGLSPYVDNNVTYFKQSSSSEALGFFLRAPSSPVYLKTATAG